MPRYLYKAQDNAGQSVSGAIVAPSRRDALSSLIERKLTPKSLNQEDGRGLFRRGVKTAALESFFDMLSDLLASGMPLAKAMDVVCRRTSDPRLRKIAGSVRDSVIDGETFADAMGQHPEAFPALTLSLIDAGEQGGFLEQSLAELAQLARREQELRGRVMSAIAYPCFLLVVGALVLLGMMVFFVPRFEPLFARMDAAGELPWATTALLGASVFLRSHLGLIAATTGAIALLGLMVSDQQREQALERFRTELPFLGPILVDLSIARFSRMLGTMLNNGVEIVRALEIARHSFGIRRFSRAIEQSSQSLQAGDSLAGPLQRSGLFPIEITEMISVGEQSNRLEKVLLAIADKVETRTQRKLEMLVKLIEPFMMVLLALVIGFLIVALLLPVFNSAGRFY